MVRGWHDRSRARAGFSGCSELARRREAPPERHEPGRQAAGLLNLLSRIRRVQLRPRRPNDILAPKVPIRKLSIATRVALCIVSACVLSAWCSRALALD